VQSAAEVIAAGQEMGAVLARREVCQGDAMPAAIGLLKGMPLQGKVITADADLLCRQLAQTFLDGKGGYLGAVKENHPEVKKPVEHSVELEAFSQGRKRPPDDVQWDKGHGRLGCRESGWWMAGR